ncbi:hypothetical protein Trydic_g5863 [Trypoxylus dichotomus]
MSKDQPIHTSASRNPCSNTRSLYFVLTGPPFSRNLRDPESTNTCSEIYYHQDAHFFVRISFLCPAFHKRARSPSVLEEKPKEPKRKKPTNAASFFSLPWPVEIWEKTKRNSLAEHRSFPRCGPTAKRM